MASTAVVYSTDLQQYWRKTILSKWDTESTPDKQRIGEIARAPDHADLLARGITLTRGLTTSEPFVEPELRYDLNEWIEGGPDKAKMRKADLVAYIREHFAWATTYSDERLDWTWEYWWHRKLWLDPTPKLVIAYHIVKGARPADLGYLRLQEVLNQIRTLRKDDD